MSLRRTEMGPAGPVPTAAPEPLGTDAGKASAASARDPTEPSPFARVMARIARRVDQGEAATAAVTHRVTPDATPAELLTLQTRIYRYAEAVDLASRFVERATSAVRTVVQGT